MKKILLATVAMTSLALGSSYAADPTCEGAYDGHANASSARI